MYGIFEKGGNEPINLIHSYGTNSLAVFKEKKEAERVISLLTKPLGDVVEEELEIEKIILSYEKRDSDTAA